LKKALVIFVSILLLVGAIAACGEESRPVSAHPGVIRLHILANSDSDADQDAKLQVRDLVLENWGDKLKTAGTTDAAWEELNALLPDIKKGVSDLLGELGMEYGVSLDTGEYDFPERDYNGETFPAGRYKALKVELGSAAGHNWWCVMFPPLCLVGEGGEMDMQEYMDLVEQLDREGVTPESMPEAPVRSWLYDKLFGEAQWDGDFFKWAKDLISGSD
jgi:stage II sporulation protein R